METQSAGVSSRDYATMLITKAGKIEWGADVTPSLRGHQAESSATAVAESNGCVGVQRWAGAAVPGGCRYLFRSICGGCPGETVNTECLAT